ncbi:hypothetical protein BST94_16220 [Nonlabens xylanidelens]|nr:hypothetical protein BST94_16220 [Nonlabens xylanidelens]
MRTEIDSNSSSRSYDVDVIDPIGSPNNSRFRSRDSNCSSRMDTASTDDGFSNPATTGTVSGVVFNDPNGNGIQDAGEPGIVGVDVELPMLTECYKQ